MYNCIYVYIHIHRVSEKNCAKLFLSELRQIFINFNNVWCIEAHTAKILCYYKHFQTHFTHVITLSC